MTQSSTQLQIQALRSTNQQRILEGILVFIAALFVSALLPSLMLQYFFADQMLTEAPLVIEHMSGVTFTIAMLYLLFVVIGLFTRGKKIAQLQRELAMMTDSSANELPDEAELQELEALVDKALQSSKTGSKSKAVNSATKSASKKASKSKAAGKK